MTRVNVYLMFDGNCEQAFVFYKSVFGGEFTYMGRFSDMPPSEKGKVSTDESGRIMHVSLPISQETVLMGSDVGGEWTEAFQAGNNFSVSINTDRREEADRLFTGLAAGGAVKMPMGETFWGDYFGMLTDQFGISWMVSFNTISNE